MTRILTGWVIVSFLAGCLPEPLPVNNIPNVDSKIVVSSQLVPDQSVAILLTRSFGALDANGDSDPTELIDQIAINDATVIIEGMGLSDTLTLIDAGVYGSVSIPFVDEGFYTLYVDSPTMGKVSATTQVKTAVTFNSLDAAINDTGFDTLATIGYSLMDIPGKSYYMVNVQYFTNEESFEPQDFLNPNIFIHLTEDEPEKDSELMGDSFNAIFRRDFFPGDTIIMQLSNIDKGYYDFLQVRKDARFNFSDFLGEPVNYPSNVVGGLGWFTLSFPDVRVITLRE
ncbi:MAG: DUF4249 domain-containing protein [Cyclobacteriaceae bacterium]